MTTAPHWGRIYAALSRAGTFSGADLALFATAPGQHFGAAHRLADLSPEAAATLAELLADVTPEDLQAAPLSEAEQGAFYLGFHQSGGVVVSVRDRHTIPASRGKAGRPETLIDWSDVNWNLGDSAIASQLGCTRQTVFARRRKKLT